MTAMALRVLAVNDYLDLKRGGGTAERTFQLSRHLARAGVKCAVLSIDADTLDQKRKAELEPAQLTLFPCWLRRFNVPRVYWSTLNELVAGADIIHMMGHWSVLNAVVYVVARKHRKPYVLCPAGALPVYGRSRWLKHLFNLLIGNAIVRSAAGWVVVTDMERDHFLGYGIASERIVTIPNGVSEEDFPCVDVPAFRRRAALPNDAPVILFMGRLAPIKGPDLLLEAFIQVRSELQSHHLVFVGPDGGLQAKLQKMVESHQLASRVHFLGYLEGADKSAAYRMADILVVPSRQEAMSIVAVEAGFCETPVLLTDQCGFHDIVSVDSRMEVPATVEGLAEGLKSILSEPLLTTELKSRFKSFMIGRYSWTQLVPEYIAYFQTILSGLQR